MPSTGEQKRAREDLAAAGGRLTPLPTAALAVRDDEGEPAKPHENEPEVHITVLEVSVGFALWRR